MRASAGVVKRRLVDPAGGIDRLIRFAAAVKKRRIHEHRAGAGRDRGRARKAGVTIRAVIGRGLRATDGVGIDGRIAYVNRRRRLLPGHIHRRDSHSWENADHNRVRNAIIAFV